MTDIVFIDKDPEQILTDTIELFEGMAGVQLNDADPERILLDCMGFREVLLRNGIEYVMRQNFVQLAEGSKLDYWGQIFGVSRNENESDDDYRSRIMDFNQSGGLGTKSAYKTKILSLDNVSDVLLFTKNDLDELVPGRVRIIPIKKVVDPVSLIESGAVHDAVLETEILNAILMDEFGIIGNTFEFEAAVPIVIGGTVNVRAEAGFDAQTLTDNINHQLNRYFGQLSLSFSSEFGLTGITNYLLNAEGLQQIVNLNFENIPVLQTGEFYQRGVININIE